MYTFYSLDCTSQAWIKFQTLPQYIQYVEKAYSTVVSDSPVGWGRQVWRTPWCFSRRAGYEPAPGFTFSLPFIIIPHTHTHTHTHNYTTQTVTHAVTLSSLLWARRQHASPSRSGPRFDPRSRQVTWVRFFLTCKTNDGKLQAPMVPRISFGPHNHAKSFITGTNDL